MKVFSKQLNSKLCLWGLKSFHNITSWCKSSHFQINFMIVSCPQNFKQFRTWNLKERLEVIKFKNFKSKIKFFAVFPWNFNTSPENIPKPQKQTWPAKRQREREKTHSEWLIHNDFTFHPDPLMISSSNWPHSLCKLVCLLFD